MTRKLTTGAHGAAKYSGLYHDAVTLAPTYLRFDTEVAERTIARVAVLMQKRKQTGPVPIQSLKETPASADRTVGEKP